MIRDATKDDLGRLFEIYLDAFPLAHSIPDECWRGHEREMRIILPYWPGFVFEAGGRVEGFLCTFRETIPFLFVAPSSQRRGIGTALLRRAMELGPFLELEVFSHNQAAVAFYRKLGFVVESRYNDPCAEQERLRMKWTKERNV